jgi:hypothetical protein
MYITAADRQLMFRLVFVILNFLIKKIKKYFKLKQRNV